jgi:hypothetical protein
MHSMKKIEAIGFEDGQTMARENSATESLTATTGGESWGESLINAIGSEQVAELFGLGRDLYNRDGILTKRAERCLRAYARGANEGWDGYVNDK